jgi:hypothetical protein
VARAKAIATQVLFTEQKSVLAGRQVSLPNIEALYTFQN